MAVCEISGKGKMYGHNVSFSQRKTRKVFKPNIQKRKKEPWVKEAPFLFLVNVLELSWFHN